MYSLYIYMATYLRSRSTILPMLSTARSERTGPPITSPTVHKCITQSGACGRKRSA